MEKEFASTIRKPRRKTEGKSALTAVFSKINKKGFAIILAGLILAGFLYYFRGLFIAATVNGQPISRLALIRELEKQGGKQTLDSLITKALIFQEFKKQNISASDEEINQEIKKVEESLVNEGQNLDQLLKTQGIPREEFREQIKIRKMLEKIVGKNLQITAQEINDYLEKNKQLLPKDADPEKIKEGIKEQLRQQKITEAVQSLLQSLREKSQINYFLKL